MNTRNANITDNPMPKISRPWLPEMAPNTTNAIEINPTTTANKKKMNSDKQPAAFFSFFSDIINKLMGLTYCSILITYNYNEFKESEVLAYLEVEEDMLEQTDCSTPEHYQQVPTVPYLASKRMCLWSTDPSEPSAEVAAY